MAKWEYLTVATADISDLAMNEHGKDGWELVALYPGRNDSVQAVFKRKTKGD